MILKTNKRIKNKGSMIVHFIFNVEFLQNRISKVFIA